MTTFRQASKTLRIKLQMAVTEEMSKDPAVRYAYGEALNAHVLSVLEDINRPRPGVLNNFDQIKVLNAVFGNGDFVVKKHLVDATEFIEEVSYEDIHIAVTIEPREYYKAPIIHAFTITSPGCVATFSDNGENHEPN